MKSMLISYNLYNKSCDFREKQSEPPGIVYLVILQLHAHTLIMHACNLSLEQSMKLLCL